jgi:hypothetical protein
MGLDTKSIIKKHGLIFTLKVDVPSVSSRRFHASKERWSAFLRDCEQDRIRIVATVAIEINACAEVPKQASHEKEDNYVRGLYRIGWTGNGTRNNCTKEESSSLIYSGASKSMEAYGCRTEIRNINASEASS